MILAIDPSSKVTGFAVMDSEGGVHRAESIKAKKRDPVWTRIDFMILELRFVLKQMDVWTVSVVIETSSGKVNPGRHSGGGSGMATYGQAVGAIRQAMKEHERSGRAPGVVVHEVPETWTGGHPKAKRQKVAARLYSEYRADRDPGGDIADAICLADHWRRKIDG